MVAYRISSECIGCTMCARNCPVKAIKGELKQRHVIDKELCVSCGLCAKLCAKGAVIMPDGTRSVRIPKDKWQKPVVDTEMCSGCSMCVEDCPKFCLEISAPAFHGDIRTHAVLAKPDECIGCGICSRRCPLRAITMTAP